MMSWLIPISLALLGGTARADQCQWVDADVAAKAKQILTNAPTVIEYCEPCGDKAPGEPQRAKTIDIATPASGFRELHVNGKAIDLAYIYVRTDHGYGNLAALAGCPATGVSPSLAIDPETPAGVMITADEHAAPAPAPPPALAPQVYVYNSTTRDTLPIALAASGGLISGAAAMLVLLVRRRRRDLRPRAIDIIQNAR